MFSTKCIWNVHVFNNYLQILKIIQTLSNKAWQMVFRKGKTTFIWIFLCQKSYYWLPWTAPFWVQVFFLNRTFTLSLRKINKILPQKLCFWPPCSKFLTVMMMFQKTLVLIFCICYVEFLKGNDPFKVIYITNKKE